MNNKKFIYFPNTVKFTVLERDANNVIFIIGPRGATYVPFSSEFIIKYYTTSLLLLPKGIHYSEGNYGTTRSKLTQAITGVTIGHKIYLYLKGVGFKFKLLNNTVVLDVGYKDSIEIKIPEQVTVRLISTTCLEGESNLLEELTQFFNKIRLFKAADKEITKKGSNEVLRGMYIMQEKEY